MKEVSSLRVKFGQSMQLLRKYQVNNGLVKRNIVQAELANEIARMGVNLAAKRKRRAETRQRYM